MNLPVLLTDKVILPYNSIQLDFTTDFDKLVIDEAETFHNNKILLVLKRTNSKNMVDINNLPNIAVVATIIEDTSLINGSRRLTLKCLNRALVHEYLYQNGTIESIISNISEDRVEQEIEVALVKKLKEELKSFLALSNENNSVYDSIKDIDNLNILTDKIAYRINFENDRLILYLMCYNSLKRMELVLEDIYKLKQLFAKEKENSGASNNKAVLSKPKKEYLLKEKITLDNKQRVKNREDEVLEFNKMIGKLEINNELKDYFYEFVNSYKILSDDSNALYTYKNYLSTALSLPWNNLVEIKDLSNISKKLDEKIYAYDKVKEIVLEHLSLKNKGFAICLVGDNGLGKTHFAKSLASAINTKFTQISMNDVKDMSDIVGTYRTLTDGHLGVILKEISNTKVSNPVFMIQDIDKINKDNYNSIVSSLISIVSNNLKDRYLNLDYNLKDVMFILTATDLKNIPEELKEYLDIVILDGYTIDEKIDIAKKYLIPLNEKKYNINIAFKDDALKTIITDYTKEVGVSKYSKLIDQIYRKVSINSKTSKPKIDDKDIVKYLGEPLNNNSYKASNTCGICYATLNNSISPIEVVLVPGCGDVAITGVLNNKIKEYISISINYIKSHLKELKIDANVFKNQNIHINFVDMPYTISNDISLPILVAILSAIKNKKISADTSFIGGLSLSGNVLGASYIKNKLENALLNDIGVLYIPEVNKKDVLKINKNITSKLKIKYVQNIMDIYDGVLKDKNEKK